MGLELLVLAGVQSMETHFSFFLREGELGPCPHLSHLKIWTFSKCPRIWQLLALSVHATVPEAVKEFQIFTT